MMKQYRVLNMSDITACPEVFELLSGIADVVSLPAEETLLRERLPDFEIYFASLHIQLDRSTLEGASRLRAIATPSTGLDHIDISTAKAREIEIVSLKEEIEFLNSVTATAELAWALLLAVVRRLPSSFDAAKKGHWARDEFRGHQLSGKTLGVLGYGRLGKMITEYGKAFRMRVLACDRKAIEPAPGIEMVDFKTLLQESDALSIHIHLTEENRNLIGRDEFAAMKRNAVLLNTSRGAIVDEAALLDALQSGYLGGAGLDVIDGEWRHDLSTHPLIRYANVQQNLVISPHIGGVTYESQAMALTHTVRKLKTYLENLSE